MSPLRQILRQQKVQQTLRRVWTDSATAFSKKSMATIGHKWDVFLLDIATPSARLPEHVAFHRGGFTYCRTCKVGCP